MGLRDLFRKKSERVPLLASQTKSIRFECGCVYYVNYAREQGTDYWYEEGDSFEPCKLHEPQIQVDKNSKGVFVKELR